MADIYYTLSVEKLANACDFKPFDEGKWWELDGRPLTKEEIQECIEKNQTKPIECCARYLCPLDKQDYIAARIRCVSHVAFLAQHWALVKSRTILFDGTNDTLTPYGQYHIAAAMFMGETHIRVVVIHQGQTSIESLQ